MADNLNLDRGYGNWHFHIYQPILGEEIGPYKGYLEVSKDFHVIYAKTSNDKKYFIASIPSPNVAYVYNTLSQDQEKK